MHSLDSPQEPGFNLRPRSRARTSEAQSSLPPSIRLVAFQIYTNYGSGAANPPHLRLLLLLLLPSPPPSPVLSMSALTANLQQGMRSWCISSLPGPGVGPAASPWPLKHPDRSLSPLDLKIFNRGTRDSKPKPKKTQRRPVFDGDGCPRSSPRPRHVLE